MRWAFLVHSRYRTSRAYWLRRGTKAPLFYEHPLANSAVLRARITTPQVSLRPGRLTGLSRIRNHFGTNVITGERNAQNPQPKRATVHPLVLC